MQNTAAQESEQSAAPDRTQSHAAAANAINRFALDLYRGISQDSSGNVLFSPYSIYQCLAMAYGGARGETAAQMANLLGFDSRDKSILRELAEVTGDILGRVEPKPQDDDFMPKNTLRTASSLWGERTCSFNPAFLAVLDPAFGAGLFPVDFIDSPQAARKTINQWVADRTNQRIRDIVSSAAITPNTLLVLANAIWFSGRWRSSIDPLLTREEPFTLIGGDSTAAQFMHQCERLGYERGDGFQVIEFPYLHTSLAFTVVLPDAGMFETLQTDLVSTQSLQNLGMLEYTKDDVALPKFEFEAGSSLVAPLMEIGMVDAFNSARADFSGMLSGDVAQPLHIDEVLHKKFICVDEQGTEASAATTMRWMTLGISDDEPPVVQIDRPFIFAILDTITGAILFLGRVMNPVA